jgi:hypothetical protein
MKQYLISEEELYDLKEMENYYINDKIDNIILSKKPVEVIAEGEVHTEEDNYYGHLYFCIGDIRDIENELWDYEGKKGKLIWIEEE